MALSLGTIPSSSQDAVTAEQPWALWLQWGAAHTARWSIAADLCPQHPGAGNQQGHADAHPQSFAAAQQTLSAGQELGTALPHFPQENVHDQQLSTGSSMESQDRRKSKGRVTSKEAI